MESFVIRIYRFQKKKPRMLVGVVEEVGVKGRKAFTNLDELWNILNSVKKKPRQSNKKIVFKREKERRDEVRIKKEIPLVFFYNKRKFRASTVDLSKNGLGIKISDKTRMSFGDIIDLKVRDSTAKAQVRWVDNKYDSSIAMAGFQIMDGRLKLKDLSKRNA